MNVPTADGRLGAGQKCEFCGATSGVAADDDGFSCLVCGAPRVLVDAQIPRSFAETPHLVRAKASRALRRQWTVAASIAAPLGVVSTLIGLLLGALVIKDEMARALVELAAFGPLLFAGFAFFCVRRASKALHARVEDAELVVAEDVLRARGPLEATELSRLLHVTPARAEQLLARTVVDRFLSETAEEAPRVRVDPDARPGESSPDSPGQTRVR